tara:strand:+ start:114 stop:317 length:204 start_codon:yes stop_codon:yes gene_type:complete
MKKGDRIHQIGEDYTSGAEHTIADIHHGYIIVHMPATNEYRIIVKNDVVYCESIQQAKQHINNLEEA